MVAPPKAYFTPEEYLALERAAEYKSEYLAGAICAMPRVNEAHNIITGNLGGELRDQFRGRPCRAYISNMRVRVAPTGLYTYPGVVAVCGPREFADAQGDTLLNPGVLIEVLSPSTEAYDRGKKFAHYQQLASLREYLLVAQDEVRLEHYVRQGEDWQLSVATNLAATIHLPALDCTLALAAIYENVEFPAAAGPPA